MYIEYFLFTVHAHIHISEVFCIFLYGLFVVEQPSSHCCILPVIYKAKNYGTVRRDL